MKIRSGFVSNSSSSSFILGLDHNPVDVADLQRMVFGNRTNAVKCDWNEDNSVDIANAADLIFEQVAETRQITCFEEFVENIKDGYFQGYPEFDWSADNPYHKYEREFNEKYKNSIQECSESHPTEYKEWNRLVDEHFNEERKKVDEAADVYAKRMWPKFKDKYVTVVSFSDNDGTHNSIMEHGNAWDGVDHLRISHH